MKLKIAEMNALKKELVKIIKPKLKPMNMKMREGVVYFQRGDKFFSCMFFVTITRTLEYRIAVKGNDYDHMFWDIIGMSENKNEPDSLRAVGAFAVPIMNLECREVNLSENLEVDAENLLNHIANFTDSFSKENENIDDFIISSNPDNPDMRFSKSLKCLAYLHKGQIEEAKNFVAECMKEDDFGSKYNGGKWFFEWVLEKY